MCQLVSTLTTCYTLRGILHFSKTSFYLNTSDCVLRYNLGIFNFAYIIYTPDSTCHISSIQSTLDKEELKRRTSAAAPGCKQAMDLIRAQPRAGFGNFVQAASIIPINDLKGAKSGRLADREQLLRCKLASCYRLVDLCGWANGIFNHITARVESEGEDHLLINPYGLLYNEITASSLLKVDLNGNIIDQGTLEFGVNKAGLALHSTIHKARPDINCIIHIHSPATVAVSAMKCGLLKLGQESIICGNVSHHGYQGKFIDEKEKELLVNNLGPTNKVLILNNQGMVACGETVEEAFYLVFNMVAACEAQVRAVALGLDNIVLPSDESREKVSHAANRGTGGTDAAGKDWKIGEVEFEALMRALDNLGYRTGYNYKLLPMVKSVLLE